MRWRMSCISDSQTSNEKCVGGTYFWLIKIILLNNVVVSVGWVTSQRNSYE